MEEAPYADAEDGADDYFDEGTSSEGVEQETQMR